MGLLRRRLSGGARGSSLVRRNSMLDTKTLFLRADVRSTSFCAPEGAVEGGFTFDAHFDWGAKLGSGSFADVYAVRHRRRRGERYAIKCLKREFRSRAERAAYLKEVQLAGALPAHPHVLGYYRAWQDERLLYVQMELCEGGTLRGQMDAAAAAGHPLPESCTWQVGAHVAGGLAHVHCHGLLHCDVKPDNVLVAASGEYKLGDLGQATAVNEWEEGVHEGDARYLSRDLLACRPSAAADVFSLGIMLLEVRSAQPLPGHGDAWEALRSADGAVGMWLGATEPTLRELVGRMMSDEPAARPSAAEVAAACLPRARPMERRASTATNLAHRSSRLLKAATRALRS